ncbi:MAG: hypothetical protein ACR2J9_00595 [Gaiellales bacterium]
MPRVAVLLLAAVCALALTACGGSTAPTSGSSSAGSGPTLDTLIGTPAAAQLVTPNLIVMGGTDFPTGQTVRIPFQVFRKDGQVLKPDNGKAELYLGATPTSPALGPYPVRELSLAGKGVTFDRKDSDMIMVAADVPLPNAGTWNAVVLMQVDGKDEAASNAFTVTADEATPAIGDAAPDAATPTLADVGGDAAKITTAYPVDTALLQDSVSALLKAHRPFVVAFATPKYCTSRICGPVIDIVQNVQRSMKGTDMAFVHAEIYTDLDPSKGAAPWVDAWHLPTEPWVFVVDAQGKITAKFEGAVTQGELEAAARAALKQ